MKSKYPIYRIKSPDPYDYRIQIKDKWWKPWRTIFIFYLATAANAMMKELLDNR